MEKNINGIVALAALVFLLVGYLFGGLYGSTETETIVELPGEDIIITEYVNVSVPTDSTPDYFGDAVAFLLDEMDDEDALLECDGFEYDFDDIELTKMYDERYLLFDEDELTVGFKVKLVYDEEDSRSCRNTVDIEVFYEDDEDAEVRLLR